MTDLWKRSAAKVVGLLKKRDISPIDSSGELHEPV